MIYAFLFLTLTSLAWAFPEFSRHGYANCTACHVSPSGGGLLNMYGRELSKEALSTWSKKGEQYFAYDLAKTPPTVNLQGYVRLLQLERNTPSVKEARTIFMQADIEGGYTKDKFSIVGSIGRQERIFNGDKHVQPISRRHYVLYKARDNLTIRAGKFNRYFGLNTPYHNSYVYRDLQFIQDTESYNVEMSYYLDKVSLFYTSILGSFQDKTSYTNEKAQTVSAQFFHNKQKLGATYYYGTDERQRRNVIGPWFILSHQKKLYWMSEAFYQERDPKAGGAPIKGFTSTNRFNFEVYKGVIPFLTFEAAKLDWTSDTSQRQSYGGGLQWFPRPHFELMANYQKDRLYVADGFFADTYWLMLNFYL